MAVEFQQFRVAPGNGDAALPPERPASAAARVSEPEGCYNPSRPTHYARTARRLSMTRISLAFGLIAGILAFGVQAQSPTESSKLILLLPGHFSGWICIDFGVAGAPPLPRQGTALIFRPRK